MVPETWWDDTGNAVGDAIDDIGNTVGDVIDDAGNAVGGAVDNITDGVSDITGDIVGNGDGTGTNTATGTRKGSCNRCSPVTQPVMPEDNACLFSRKSMPERASRTGDALLVTSIFLYWPFYFSTIIPSR